jgi:hypothetical protein
MGHDVAAILGRAQRSGMDLEDFTVEVRAVPNDAGVWAERWLLDLREDGWSGDYTDLFTEMPTRANTW